MAFVKHRLVREKLGLLSVISSENVNGELPGDRGNDNANLIRC
jgi:hypothetical protein